MPFSMPSCSACASLACSSRSNFSRASYAVQKEESRLIFSHLLPFVRLDLDSLQSPPTFELNVHLHVLVIITSNEQMYFPKTLFSFILFLAKFSRLVLVTTYGLPPLYDHSMGYSQDVESSNKNTLHIQAPLLVDGLAHPEL